MHQQQRYVKSGTQLHAVGQRGCSFFCRAVCAAENNLILLDAMPDDPAITVRTNGSKLLDRAFEAVKGVGLVGNPHFESLVIIVPALITSGHGSFLSPALRLINLLNGDWFRRDAVEAIKIAKCLQVGLVLDRFLGASTMMISVTQLDLVRH
jgi:hypothetical protein